MTSTLKIVYSLEDFFYKSTSNVSLLSKSSDCFVPSCLPNSFCKRFGIRLVESAIEEPGIAIRSSRFAVYG